LYEPAPPYSGKGRPRKKGTRLPTPAHGLNDPNTVWTDVALINVSGRIKPLPAPPHCSWACFLGSRCWRIRFIRATRLLLLVKRLGMPNPYLPSLTHWRSCANFSGLPIRLFEYPGKNPRCSKSPNRFSIRSFRPCVMLLDVQSRTKSVGTPNGAGSMFSSSAPPLNPLSVRSYALPTSCG